MLTGTYPWRNSRAKIITGGSLIIDTTEMTIPKLLKTKGYHTGIVGKWHLGLGIDKINYNSKISPGPNQIGFDYSHIIGKMEIGFPVVDIKSEFHSPFRYGDSVTATIWISKVGNKSCTWQYRFHNQNEELLWSSEQVTVCVSMKDMTSLVIPDTLRNGLEACTNE